jgi:anti-anti-sigma regulatory factor
MDRSDPISLPPSAVTTAVIPLPAELGIEAASELHRELIAHVDDPAPVVLDAAEVARIHTAALQLFCLFCRDRRAQGYRTDWRAPSNAMRAAAALLGVTTLLNMSQEAQS